MIGVASYVSGTGSQVCADEKIPDVFARVTAVKEWILENTDGTQDSDCGL